MQAVLAAFLTLFTGVLLPLHHSGVQATSNTTVTEEAQETSVTPSVTLSTTPSVTPSTTPSVTPSVTPSTTPSVSPSVTPAQSGEDTDDTKAEVKASGWFPFGLFVSQQAHVRNQERFQEKHQSASDNN